jgi:hypothetical protein
LGKGWKQEAFLWGINENMYWSILHSGCSMDTIDLGNKVLSPGQWSRTHRYFRDTAILRHTSHNYAKHRDAAYSYYPQS